MDWDELEKKYSKGAPPKDSGSGRKKLAAVVVACVAAAVGASYFLLFSEGSGAGSSAMPEQEASGQSGAQTGPESGGLSVLPVPTEATKEGQANGTSVVQNDTAEEPYLPAEEGTACTGIEISGVSGSEIELVVSGPGKVSDAVVKDIFGNEVGTFSDIQSGASSVPWSGQATGLIVSGTCKGVAVSDACLSTEDCWNASDEYVQ